MSLDELARLEVEIAAERARRSGDPVLLCDEGVDVRLRPQGGAVLAMRYATWRGETLWWYATTEAAMSRLHAIAAVHGRVVNGRGVDLTAPGCHDSWAEVRVR